MKEDFDHIAQEYDSTFTHTAIGKHQRTLVYQFLEQEINSFQYKNILEINAGTGEDALWLNNKGSIVTCTDISPKMVDVAKQKHKNTLISHQVIDVTKINQYNFTNKFDVIFSNFGGLNCLNKIELDRFLNQSMSLLKTDGKLILVIMPSFCLWETIYFLFKFKFKQAFRRQSKKGVPANVEGIHVSTYYHSPKTTINLAKDYKLNQLKPVGFYIPPSYLEPFFIKRVNLLNKLWKKEQQITNKKWYAKMADHYYLSLQKK